MRSKSPLLFLCCALAWACGPAGRADLQILSISDWHGQIDPLSVRDSAGNTVTMGGVGLLSAYFKKAREANPVTLTFTAGDAIGASPAISSFFEEKPAIAALNQLKLDATTFGNHEFDRGMDVLKQRMGEAGFAYVSTNLTNAAAEFGAKVSTPYRMFEVGRDKVKVAVLGLTNPDAPMLQFPGRMGSLQVEDPVASANAAAKKARQAGAVAVIALAHLGALNVDANNNPVGPVIEVARGLQGVDVLLADHTDFAVNTMINDVLVVENRSKGRTYAKIQLGIVDGKVVSRSATLEDPAGVATAPLPTGQSCPATACPDSFSCVSGRCQKVLQEPDPEAEAQLKPWRDELAQRMDVKIGTTDGIFVRDGSTERKQEVPIGDLVADALLDKYRARGAQIAFTNGGGLRAPLPSSYAPRDGTLVRTNCSATSRCDLVAGDVYTLLPFGNTCVVRKMTGALLWQVLEHSVARIPDADGRFLQIAGFRLEYSASAAPGSRVMKVTLSDGREIPRNDTTEYTVVTNDFTNAGGDGYSMLTEATPSASLEVLADVVMDYIRSRPDGRISLSDYPANRIVRNP